jgi:hypothetical protein
MVDLQNNECLQIPSLTKDYPKLSLQACSNVMSMSLQDLHIFFLTQNFADFPWLEIVSVQEIFIDTILCNKKLNFFVQIFTS